MIDKNYAEQLENKVASLRAALPSSKVVHLVMVTSFGLKGNKYSDMVDDEIKLKELF